MSDNFIEILIYGGIILFSAIGAADKARRQKQKRAEGSSSPDRSPWDIDEEEAAHPVWTAETGQREVVLRSPAQPRNAMSGHAAPQADKSGYSPQKISEKQAAPGGYQPMVYNSPGSVARTAASARITSSMETAAKGEYADQAVRDIIAAEGGRSTRQTTNERIKKAAQDSHKDSHLSPEERDVMLDFDLRKAVIYSEMLKPKYTEY